jgi:nucleoside-diphosphate-sugar epimerase
VATAEYSPFPDIETLEERMTRPTTRLEDLLARHPGDILVLGAGGKIGYHVARTAQRTLDAIGSGARVTAVSRFSQKESREPFDLEHIATIQCDLTDRAAVDRLPVAPNIIYMAGRKFGTSGAEEETWAANVVAPVHVCERFGSSSIVVFSTGCVYALQSPSSGGSREGDPLEGVGEYAQSAVARERIFTRFSNLNGTRICFFRLNYAVDLRYGVLHDIARAVIEERPISLRSAMVNVIWQGDAVERAILCLGLASSPPAPINVTGPETASVRSLADRFGALFGKKPIYDGAEGETSYLSDSAQANALFGYPSVPLLTMVEWTAAWIRAGLESWNKPTHFEQTGGVY